MGTILSTLVYGEEQTTVDGPDETAAGRGDVKVAKQRLGQDDYGDDLRVRNGNEEGQSSEDCDDDDYCVGDLGDGEVESRPTGGEERVESAEFMSVAWKLIDSGDMHGAISALAAAMREQGWSEARIGDEIRAQVARASAGGGTNAAASTTATGASPSPAVEHVSLLEEQERSDILVDCLKDGSSLVCPACHAIVARRRFGDHRRIWCVANGQDVDDESDVSG